MQTNYHISHTDVVYTFHEHYACVVSKYLGNGLRSRAHHTYTASILYELHSPVLVSEKEAQAKNRRFHPDVVLKRLHFPSFFDFPGRNTVLLSTR